MSLNWKEIDAVLEELPLPGSYVQRIDQPDYRNLVLSLYRPGERYYLLCSLEQNATRIHRIRHRPKRPKKQQRFAQMLRARIEGGQVSEAEQLHCDRIVKLAVKRAGETTLLWIRLWGGQANIIVTDENLTIIDAFFRRPKRNETSGNVYDPDANAGIHQSDPEERRRRLERFELRDFPGEGDFNDRVARWYAERNEQTSLEQLREKLLRELESRENKVHAKLKSLRDKQQDSALAEQYKEQGDVIMANLHRIQRGDKWLEAESLTDPEEHVAIRLDPEKDPHENAEQFYSRYKKARAGRERLSDEIENQEQQLEEIERQRQAVRNASDSSQLAARDKQDKQSVGRKPASPEPGLRFHSGGFRILVGRTAKENDELLRRHVKGNDVWLHVRDYAGSYVFIRHIPGKSVPLEVLLDAGNLAIHFSKARNAGLCGSYYTFVKHLRRAKNGKPGLVLPTQEKNLSVDVEPERIERLKGA